MFDMAAILTDLHPIRSAEDNPKEFGSYLITRKNIMNEFVIEVWYWITNDYEKVWMDTNGLDSNAPIAWTPLPAPYRPEKEESK
jgi:hypothetical protein